MKYDNDGSRTLNASSQFIRPFVWRTYQKTACNTKPQNHENTALWNGVLVICYLDFFKDVISFCRYALSKMSLFLIQCSCFFLISTNCYNPIVLFAFCFVLPVCFVAIYIVLCERMHYKLAIKYQAYNTPIF